MIVQLSGLDEKKQAARLAAELSERQAKVKKAGGKSCEGFYFDKDGQPKAVDDGE